MMHQKYLFCLAFASIAVAIYAVAEPVQTYDIRIDPNVTEHTAYDGQALNLTCSVVGIASPDKIRWEFNKGNTFSSVYIINNMTAADAGVYTCHAIHDYWSDKKAILLKWNATAASLHLEQLLKKNKTTVPSAPEKIDIEKLDVECEGESCELEWSAPEDNGAPIHNYTILISQPNATGAEAFKTLLINETANEPRLLVTVPVLNATYKLHILATNAIGTSQSARYEFKPIGAPRQMWKWLIVALACIFLLLLLTCCMVILITKKWRHKRSDKGRIHMGNKSDGAARVTDAV